MYIGGAQVRGYIIALWWGDFGKFHWKFIRVGKKLKMIAYLKMNRMLKF